MKLNRWHIVLLLLAGLGGLAACEKGDFSGEEILRGRLVYVDQFSGSGREVPLGSREVKLAQSPSDTLNFKYSTTTDKDGYFVFEHLSKDLSYDLFFQDSVQGRMFTAIRSGRPTHDAFLLQAAVDESRQNGLALTLRDALGAPVTQASVCVFNSLLRARADTCAGRLFELTSDGTGRAVRYQLAPGKYYVLSKVQLGTARYRAFDSVEVKASGIATRAITFVPNVTAQNGVLVMLQDGTGAPVANAPVCVFNNLRQARADTCAGSLFNLTTDATGRASRLRLAPGKYYLLSKVMLGNRPYRGFDSVQVTTVGVVARTLTLLPNSFQRNGFEITVLDRLNTPINNAPVCVFNSAILARIDTCAGSFLQRATTVNGKLSLYNLNAGKYYFRITAKFGNLTLKGYDSVTVAPTGIVQQSVIIR